MYFLVYKDISGYWRWRLCGIGDRIVAESGEAYYSKLDCMNMIRHLQNNALNAPIREVMEVEYGHSKYSS